MRYSSLRLVFCVALVTTLAASAHAQWVMEPMTGISWTPGDVPGPETPFGTYGVYTGVATTAGNLFLLEDAVAPVRDDVVPFDGAADPINDYVAVAGSVTRSVIETDVDNGNGTRTLNITVTGTDPILGGPGDLWPAGFTGGGQSLSSGGFGIGITLPASLGGADPLNLTAGDSILSSTVAISTGGVFAAPLVLPSTFYGSAAYPANTWNGVIGIVFSNPGATGTLVQDGIRLSITYVVPEPASLSLLALGGLALTRRRRV